jgi:outer membrane protein assembly factor BamA
MKQILPSARRVLNAGRQSARQTKRMRHASELRVEMSLVRHLLCNSIGRGVRGGRRSCLARAAVSLRAVSLSAALVAGAIASPVAMPQAENKSARLTANRPIGTDATIDQMLASYEGQNVSSVEVAGRPDFMSSAYSSLFAQKPGEPFSQEKVNRTAAAIKSAGKFEEVRIQVEPEFNGVRILYIVEPAVYFGIFQFPGAERFPYSKVLQVANYPIQTPYNAGDVEDDRKKLAAFFQQEGYFEVSVSPEVKVDQGHEIANIVYAVSLSRRAKFGDIEIANVSPGQAADLTHNIQSLSARMHAAAVRPGKPYHHSTLNRATKLLQARLQKQGWLGAHVTLVGAEYHSETNRADIHFSVDLGEKTNVQIEGAHLWSWTRKSLLPVYQGIGVDDESVQEGRQAIESYFQAKGYFDVKVETRVNKSSSGGTITYRIVRGQKHKVGAVTLMGNASIPSAQLTPHLTVQKKHLFSVGKFSDQLIRASVKNLTAVYQSEGFSSVKVTAELFNRTGDVQVSFRVAEGPRDVVNSLTIEGADTFPQSQFAPGGLKVVAGQPYSQAHVEQDRANIVAHYLQAGYLNCSFRETATEASKSEPHRINVIYNIDEGPRVNTGNVLTLGRVHTQQRLIDRDVAGVKREQPLTETELLTSGSKLYDHTGVFDWAEVDPKRPITTQTTEDVVVKVHEAQRNSATYGVGFEVIDRGGSIPSGTVALPNLPPIGLPSNFKTSEATFYGPRGSFQYTRNNVDGKGDSVSVTGFAGRLDQRAAAYYIVPNFQWTLWKATTSFSYERDEENPIFSSQQELATMQIQRNLDRNRKNTLFLRYSFSKVDLTRILIPALVPEEDQHIRLSTIAANFTRDTRDNPLDEHKGVLDSIEIDFNSTKLGSSADFAKVTAQAALYRRGFHNIVWASSVRIGLAQPFSNSFVPLSEEFFSGGGNSLRGYPLDGAGPQREVYVCSAGQSSGCPEIQVPAGGNELLLINSEARIPLPFKKGLGIVPFYDGGNVFPSVGFHDFTSLYSNNVGIGLRYATPVGPIRIDVGRNLNPVAGINATQYFVTIGQAF